MSGATRLTESIIAALADTGMPVYSFAEVVDDGAPKPCLLLNIESDTLIEHVGIEARRRRGYAIEAVFRRGATEQDLNGAARSIMTALGFGLLQFERPIKGLHTEEQDIEYEFAGNGRNHTTVTVVVNFDYIETYER